MTRTIPTEIIMRFGINSWVWNTNHISCAPLVILNWAHNFCARSMFFLQKLRMLLANLPHGLGYRATRQDAQLLSEARLVWYILVALIDMLEDQ